MTWTQLPATPRQSDTDTAGRPPAPCSGGTDTAGRPPGPWLFAQVMWTQRPLASDMGEKPDREAHSCGQAGLCQCLPDGQLVDTVSQGAGNVEAQLSRDDGEAEVFSERGL